MTESSRRTPTPNDLVMHRVHLVEEVADDLNAGTFRRALAGLPLDAIAGVVVGSCRVGLLAARRHSRVSYAAPDRGSPLGRYRQAMATPSGADVTEKLLNEKAWVDRRSRRARGWEARQNLNAPVIRQSTPSATS